MAKRDSPLILVVEDEPALRELSCAFLERAGYRVESAADGSEALALAAQLASPPALVLTDVILPGISPRELAETLHKRFPEVRFLYVSGYPAETIAERGLLEPGAPLLQKPFTRDALTRKVREVLDGSHHAAG